MTTLPTTGTATFNYSGHTVTVTVGTSGYYDITAFGAQGGSGSLGAGGLGAMASGEIYLQAGAQLEIIVGGAGQNGPAGGGGGGGGSFVIETNSGSGPVDVNEVIAGGGGGGGLGAGGGGLTQGTGGTGRGSGGAGGVNGAAGQGGNYLSAGAGGGGGGFTGGAAGTPFSAQAGSTTGASFAGGSGFSASSHVGGNGGFGGGGGGIGETGENAGGGGGGFGGGGGGGSLGGGGGGSFVDASVTGVSKTAAIHSGNGLVTITAQSFQFGYTGNIQTFTVQFSGYYDITAFGAQGGSGSLGAGGLGAMASGEIYLQAGAQLEIIVGGAGQNGPAGGGGGGGGSFVIETNSGSGPVDVNEVIAGGGGGGGLGAGGGGLTQGTGGTGRGSGGAGGVNGAAGQGGNYLSAGAGGGGGGFTGGAAGTPFSAQAGSTTGASFAGGSGFSASSHVGGNGGFGGGGGGIGETGENAGGGGGGFGGGGGGGSLGGGGGGSFVDASVTGVSKTAAIHSGAGFVTITQVICFTPGTLIATPGGEVPVEMLKRGDLVMTSDGRSMPVTWIGLQTVSTRFGDPLRVLPIRIRAGALGENVPCRDLLVTPDHALLVDDVLVQAGALVNGTSIVRERNVPERLTYYHVELDDHSLILAENTPAETFVDNVDRLAFDNWAEHEALYPRGKAIVEMPYPRAKSHRQVPKAVKRRLEARAAKLYEVLPAVA